ncbi:MAG: hypothetical protein U0V04_09835 [Spirosomataceae bacterium]|jgi:hypothetical protein
MVEINEPLKCILRVFCCPKSQFNGLTKLVIIEVKKAKDCLHIYVLWRLNWWVEIFLKEKIGFLST